MQACTIHPTTKTTNWFWHAGPGEYNTKAGWYTSEEYQHVLKPVARDLAGFWVCILMQGLLDIIGPKMKRRQFLVADLDDLLEQDYLKELLILLHILNSYMSLFNFFFKKKKTITYLGRGGLKYFNGKDEFYIDTNNYYGKHISIEILWNNITPVDEKGNVTETEKKKIALNVKKELENDGIHVEITPPLSIDFIIENE
ncbi:hypothetical protein [Filimonas effusa]|nr:hypothetical protein [Filimonas effusa]